MSTLSSVVRLTGLCWILTAMPAAAQEPLEVGERIKALFRSQGLVLDYATVSGDASEMRLNGVILKSPGEEDAFPVGSFTLYDVIDDGENLVIGEIAMDRLAFSEDDIAVVIDGVAIGGLKVPPQQALEAGEAIPLYDWAELGELSVSQDGATLFQLSKFSVAVEQPEADGKITFSGGAERFFGDLAKIEDAEAREVIDALGYQTLTGAMEMAGSWNPADGRTIIESYDLIFNDAGRLSLSLDIAGYTAEFQKALRDAQEKMAGDGKDDPAAGLAMLGLLQQLTFHGAAISFEDKSLTGRIIDYVAAQQGTRPVDIVNQAKALVPFMLAQLNNPEFTAMVADATSRFLDNPQSLTITASPAQPVPFALLMATAMSTPQALIEQLNVTVTANGG
jgi:hypothetical protein